MSDTRDIVERLSGMSADHGPDGWPAVQMRDITALCEEVTRLRAELAEAQKLARDDFNLRAEQRDERDRLRADFAALQHALVGDTGASAIETAHRLRAALAQAGAPEGWQLVPVEPTPWMLQALFGYWMDCINNPKQRNVATAEYKAMLTAAEALPHHTSPAQREPLSEAEIARLSDLPECWDDGAGGDFLHAPFARAVERAHGIGTSGTKGAAS